MFYFLACFRELTSPAVPLQTPLEMKLCKHFSYASAYMGRGKVHLLCKAVRARKMYSVNIQVKKIQYRLIVRKFDVTSDLELPFQSHDS